MTGSTHADRRKTDDIILELLRDVGAKVDNQAVQLAKVEVTLANQIETIKKYNDHGSRIVALETAREASAELVEKISQNCARIQTAKEEKEKDDKAKAEKKKERARPPWPTVVTGTILILISVAVNVAVNLWIK